MITFRQERSTGAEHRELMEWLKEFELALASPCIYKSFCESLQSAESPYRKADP